MWPFKSSGTIDSHDSYIRYDGDEIQGVSLNKYNETNYALGNKIYFFRRVKRRGRKLIADYFQKCDSVGNTFLDEHGNPLLDKSGKPIHDVHPHTDYSLFSEEEYSYLLSRFLEERRKGRGLLNSDLEKALKFSNGDEESVLVHVLKKGDIITPKPVAKVRVKK